MKSKKNKEKTVFTILMIVVSLVMGIVSAIITSLNPRANTPALPVYIVSNMFQGVAAGIVLSQIIPFEKLAKKIGEKFGASCPQFKYIVLGALPFALIGAVLVPAVICAINISMARSNAPADQLPPAVLMYMSSYLPLIIPSFAGNFILTVLLTPVLYKMQGIKAADKEA